MADDVVTGARTGRLAAALGLALAACSSSDTLVLAPAIELPAAGSEADPLPGLGEVELAVGVAGDPDDLVGKTFTRGQTLALPGVPLVDDLVVHMSGRAGGAEVAYGRTCALDLRSDASLTAPHLYFARTVKWAAATPPPANANRTGGLAFVAPDGSALYLDGRGGQTGLPQAGVDHFDPRTGTWLEFQAVDARTGAVLATLGDGSALVLGGRDANGGLAGFYERIDGAPFRPLQVQRTTDSELRMVEHAAASLADGAVVVMGGRTPDLQDVLVTTGAVWKLEAAVGGGLKTPRKIGASLAVPRAQHTLTRLSDDLGALVLVAGGVDALGTPVARAELYRPLREDFSAQQAQLQHPRFRHAAVRMPDGSVLIIGGLQDATTAVATLELYSIDAGFQDVGAMPGGDHPAGLIDFSATPLADGRVLLAGGRLSPGSAPLATAFIVSLDPTDGTVDVSQTDDLATPRAGHQAVLLCDGTVLLVGGTDAADAVAERYNPPSIGRR